MLPKIQIQIDLPIDRMGKASFLADQVAKP